MKIDINKNHNRYTFSIKRSDGKELYSSGNQFFLIPSIKSSYPYAWEAYRDAKRIPTYHVMPLGKQASEEFVSPVTVEVSAEDMLEDHYNTILKGIDDKARSADKKEDKEMAYGEIKMITSELLAIKGNLDNMKEQQSQEGQRGKKVKDIETLDDMISHLRKVTNKYFPDLLARDKKEKAEVEKAQKAQDAEMASMDGMDGGMGGTVPAGSPQNPLAMASKTSYGFDDDFEESILEHYAESVCEAIQSIHPDAICDINVGNKDIYIIENEEPILNVRVGENLMVTDIIPKGDLYKIYPYHKSTFYQRYWKPIVEKIGHILVEEGILLVPGKTSLPDLPPKAKIFTVNGWDMGKNKGVNLDVAFKGKEGELVWLFEATKSEKIVTANTEDDNIASYERDYSNALVKCINPNLKSLYGRVGTEVQGIKGINEYGERDIVEVDVDWGRGLETQRMAKKDIELAL